MRLLLLLLLVLPYCSAQHPCTRGQGPNSPYEKSLTALEQASAQVGQAVTPAKAAAAWLRLNQRANEFVRELNFCTVNTFGKSVLSQVVLDTPSPIRIFWCEPDAHWAARPTGFLIYSQFLPNGPEAEDAWWYGRLPNNPACGQMTEADPPKKAVGASKHIPHS